jgi:hypothetical protein
VGWDSLSVWWGLQMNEMLWVGANCRSCYHYTCGLGGRGCQGWGEVMLVLLC